MKERNIQNEIKLTHSKGDCRLFTNDQGFARLPDGTGIKYGLGNDSPDLVGVKSVTITQEMVGKKIGVSAWIEVKVPGKSATPKQQNFLNKMTDLGAIAGTARSSEEVQNIFDKWVERMTNGN